MWGRIAGLMLGIGWAWTGVALAQASEMPERPRFVFITRPEVIVKMVQPSTASSIRGKLLSLTDSEVVIDTGKKTPGRGRSDGGSSISFERIESLRTLDGEFEFTPKEDFQAVSKRIVAAFASVTIEDASLPAGSAQSTYIPPTTTTEEPVIDPAKVGHAGTLLAPKVPKNQKPPVAKPPVKGLGQSGFGGIKSLTKPKKTDPAPADTPTESTEPEGTTEPATTPPVDPTAGATEVLLCSNCGKEIPKSAVKIGVCPHCKIAFSNVTGPPSKTTQNPFQKPGTGTAGAGNGAFTATSPSVPPSVPPTNTGSQVVENSGFSIDAIPNWAKGGMFLLLVLVGWHLLMNR